MSLMSELEARHGVPPLHTTILQRASRHLICPPSSNRDVSRSPTWGWLIDIRGLGQIWKPSPSHLSRTISLFVAMSSVSSVTSGQKRCSQGSHGACVLEEQ